MRNLKPNAQNQERNIHFSKFWFWKCQIQNPQLKVQISGCKMHSPDHQNQKFKIQNLKSKSQNRTSNFQNSQLKNQNPLPKLQLPTRFTFFEIVCRPKWHKWLFPPCHSIWKRQKVNLIILEWWVIYHHSKIITWQKVAIWVLVRLHTYLNKFALCYNCHAELWRVWGRVCPACHYVSSAVNNLETTNQSTNQRTNRTSQPASQS